MQIKNKQRVETINMIVFMQVTTIEWSLLFHAVKPVGFCRRFLFRFSVMLISSTSQLEISSKAEQTTSLQTNLFVQKFTIINMASTTNPPLAAINSGINMFQNNPNTSWHSLLTTDNPVFCCWVFWSCILVIKMLLMAPATGLQRFRKKVQRNLIIF